MSRAVLHPVISAQSDRAGRLQALDPTRSFIVQAPAGSGKTELLIQRFLVLLAEVALPESILALTFTRKAAGEMRQRVIAALGRAAGPEPGSGHERETWRLASRALARDQSCGWRLLENPSRLRIQTIDSLAAGLVGRMPWVSRLGAPPEPGEDLRHLYRRAARRTLAPQAGASDPAVPGVMAHLDNDPGLAERLLAGMLERRDHWLRHVVGSRGGSGLRDRFESVLRRIIADELTELAARFPDAALAPTLDCARFAAANLADAGVESPLLACRDLEGLPDPGTEGLDRWRGLREMFLNRGGERRIRPDVRHGFPPTPEGRAFKAALAAIELEPEVVSRLDGVARLPDPTYTDAHWAALESLLGLLPRAAGELKLVFRDAGAVDFTEIAHAARTALGSPIAPTDLAFALDCRISHVLVDEFQDTSQSQWDLLAALTADWQPTESRTAFVVGDPMQSIYGFREADVALFLRARQEGLGRVGLDALTLSTNFRSTAPIVDWVNRSLGPAFPASERRLTGAVTYEASVAFEDPVSGDRPSGVTVHPLPDDDAEREARRVAEIIRETRERDPSGTIGVLVRARSHLTRIVAVLRRQGIGFEALEIDPLGTRSVVSDLLALTRALLDPADRISWLAILRAPWCGLTLGDLERLAGSDASVTIWDRMRSCPGSSEVQTSPGLSSDGHVRLGRVFPVLDDALGRRGTMPLGRWVEATWVALGGPACLSDPTDLEDATACLELLTATTPGAHIEDEERFQEAMDRLFAHPDAPAEGGSLQLLTIHRAKGLEFDTVILPGLARVPPPSRPSLLSWLEYVESGGEARLLLAPIREPGTGSDPLSAYLAGVESERRAHETTRLLYVAATRARRRLHLVGHAVPDSAGGRMRPPDPRSLLARIWDAVEGDFTRLTDVGDSAPQAPDSDESVSGGLRRLARDWRMPAAPEPVRRRVRDPDIVESDPLRHPTFDWASDLQRRVGIVVHAMLQRVTPAAPSGQILPWPEETIRAALVSEGVGPANLGEAFRRVETAIRNTLEDARGRWILQEHQDDHREYPLSRWADGTVRRSILDRTFVEDGVRWIIDYKTGTHEGGSGEDFLDNEKVRYREQLEGYARAMRALDPRPIRLGLYYPMLGGWREWRFDDAGGAPFGSGTETH